MGTRIPILDIALLAALLLLSLLAYRGSLQNGFMADWDDNKYVLWNDGIKSLSPEALGALFSRPYFANYHPLTMLSYAVQYGLSGLSPEPYHALNLALHLLNMILVFVFMRLLTGRVEIAGVVAGIFALHPMHVESVAWISARKDVLYAFFFLAAMVAYLLYVRRGRQYRFLAAALVLFVLSLLSKSAAAALPLVLLLIDYYEAGPLPWWRGVVEKIPFFILSLIFVYVALATQDTGGATAMAPHFPFYDRVFFVSYAAMFYIVKFALPWGLCAVYYYPDPAKALPFSYVLAPVLVLLAIWGVFKAGRHRKPLAWGALFYLSTIFMVLQFVPLGRAITADRYSYIPFIGLGYIVGVAYCRMADRSPALRRGLRAAALALAVVMAILTAGRCKVWAGGVALWDDAVSKNPGHYHAWAGRAYSRMEAADYAGAFEDYSEALKLNGADADVINNRGTALLKLGRFAEAVADFDRCIRQDPRYPMAHFNKGQAVEKLNGDFAAAVGLYGQAIGIDPQFALAYSARGLARFRLGDYDGAVADCDAAIRIRPDMADAHQNRGTANVGRKRYREAVEDFDRAIGLDPGFALAFSNRGVAKFHLGDRSGACEDWRAAAGQGNPEAQRFMKEQCGETGASGI